MPKQGSAWSQVETREVGEAGPGACLLSVVRRADYPPLGWLIDASAEATAFCGDGVDTFGYGLVEGCWPGDFGESAFLGCPSFFGSGAVYRDGRLWYCPPGQNIDALYVLLHRGRVLISNSMFLLYAESGAPLDDGFDYTTRLNSLLYGIDDYQKLIYESPTTKLYRIIYDDFTIEGETIRIERKKDTADFADYAGYRGYLSGTVAALVGNAADPRRRRRHHLLAACSSGYDSSACMVLAAEHGCRRAITLRTGRGGDIDSGCPVAEALGLECVERERPERPTGSFETEIAFLMSGMSGGDYPIAAFADLLEDAVLFTGYNGDNAWSLNASPDRSMRRGENTGCSTAEYRLQAGFFHVPVPFIGALRKPEIIAISRSAEMAPYRIGGSYDRPIARRLLEEAGVPRRLFGQKKRAMALVFSWGPGYLSDTARTRFEGFLKSKRKLWRINVQLQAFLAANLAFKVLRKVRTKVGLTKVPSEPLFKFMMHRFMNFERSNYANLLFLWAMREALMMRQGVGSFGQTNTGAGGPRSGRVEGVAL